jgi:hypothetical protein
VATVKLRVGDLKRLLLSLNTSVMAVSEIQAAIREAGLGEMDQPHIHGYLKRLGLKYKKKDLSKKVYLHPNRNRKAPRGAVEIERFVTEKGWLLCQIIDTKGVDLSVKGKILEVTCPKGHPKKTPLSRFFEKQNCMLCMKEAKRSEYEQKVRDHFVSNGITFEGTEGKEFVGICEKGHRFNVLFNNFKKSNSCPECYYERKGFSLAEVEIQDFIRSIYSGEVIVRDRSLISPSEVDIYIPEFKLAIEYNGLYFHSYHPNRHQIDSRCKFKSEHDAKMYHRRKLDACTALGIRLISIFEDEWIFQKKVCRSKIQNLLGLSQRLFARSLEVRVLTSTEARAFMSENHLQGYRGGYSLGLVGDGVIYCAMTLSKPIRKHTASAQTVEISRFSSLVGYNIVGGFSKLLKAAKSWAVGCGYTKIKSHCDLRWGTGGVYSKNGFEKVSETKATPHYVKGLQRYRNQSLRKTESERLSPKTEKVLRFEQGFSLIYDCGHSAWEIPL